MDELVPLRERSLSVEHCSQAAKQECSLHGYHVRRSHGWRRRRWTSGRTSAPTPLHRPAPLPFDYRKEPVGSGKRLPGAAARNPGGALWDLPPESSPLPGHIFKMLSMDYKM